MRTLRQQARAEVNPMSELTAARLRELLHYDPETGLFRWREPAPQGRPRNDPAGTLTGEGYLSITVDGRSYSAHRLAVLYVTGEWPVAQVDHRDGCRAHNWFTNLRDVEQCINMQNQRRPQAHNTTGFLGVTIDRSRASRKKFRASIWIQGKNKYLGWFDTPEAASGAYTAAKRLLHPGCTI